MSTEIGVLETPSDATSEWLSSVLGLRVEILANEPIADAGIVSPVARLRLDTGAGPSSVIVKCAPLNAEWRARVNRLGLLKTEAYFYREIGPESGMPVPQCWYSAFRESDGRCTIVMEDLDPLVPGDNELGLTHEQGLIAIRLLARMHSRHWMRVGAWPWLAERARAQATTFAATKEAVPSVLERYGDRIPASMPKHLADIGDSNRDPQAEERNATHTTLVHGDFHAANIAFGTEPGAVKVFDWQLAMATTPGADLVKLILNGMTVESRRNVGLALLESYREEMIKAGVAIDGSDLHEMVHDALLARIGASVRVAHGATADSFTERWALLCFERMGLALDDGW